MDDKEVGELWNQFSGGIYPTLTTGKMRNQIVNLIRKLVKERTSYWDDPGAALESFGIDYRTWKGE